MSWWETLHLVTWWKRLGIYAIKTGQDAPSWIWCTERLSFFGGGHIVLQRFVHVPCHFQPLPTKLVFAYFDRGSYIYIHMYRNIYAHMNFLTIQFTNLVDGHLSHEHKTIMGILASPTQSYYTRNQGFVSLTKGQWWLGFLWNMPSK